ncbi:MAG: hypothetical protein KDD22_06990, partial [Bdellovibrionales bacterium]|nr:hypothetical protein [Bdellovibrionales bacterium]
MADENNNSTPVETTGGESQDLSLADLDSLLSEDDPEFAKALSEVREAGETTDVDIEPLSLDESISTENNIEENMEGPEEEIAAPRISLKNLRSINIREAIGYLISRAKQTVRPILQAFKALKSFTIKQW